jgi:transposase InsO family protein
LLIFIDDFSRKIWVYLLKLKYENFDKFKEFKALVEKKSGQLIKILSSDRGGEYYSKSFKHTINTLESRDNSQEDGAT